MKNNFKIFLNNFNLIVGTQKFKLVFIFTIVLSAYCGCYLSYKMGYVEGLITNLTEAIFIFIFHLILFFNSLNTYSIIEKNYSCIIRYETYKKYFAQLIKNIIFSYTMVFILNILFLLIFSNIFAYGIGIFNIQNYGISNLIYLIFVTLRLYIFIMLINIIEVCLLKLIGQKLTFVFVGLISILLVMVTYTNEIISSITQLPLIMWEFLLQKSYSNFFMEILFSTLAIFVLISIVKLFKFLVNRSDVKVGE